MGIRLEHSLSVVRYVTSEQKPAIRDDEVGHGSNLASSEGCNGLNKGHVCMW